MAVYAQGRTNHSGGPYQRKAEPFSHTFRLPWIFSRGMHFSSPNKLTFISRRYGLILYTAHVQTPTQRGKNLPVDRPPGGGAPMVQPAQWLIRLCMHC